MDTQINGPTLHSPTYTDIFFLALSVQFKWTKRDLQPTVSYGTINLKVEMVKIKTL